MDRTKSHLLLKLNNRQIYGSFRKGHFPQENSYELFKTVPDRLIVHLKSVIPNIKKQVFLGTSRCGNFIITYSFTSDTTMARLVSWHRYKYRLHWYAYRPGAQAKKVAEVQLFDNQDIEAELNVGIAQWPNVNDKLVVYGYTEESNEMLKFDEEETESRRYYITVTTLPSLHNCKDCKSVAESFDEEDMAANWDSCIVLSCLRHGLTIHTTVDVAYPFPSMDFGINLKIDNKIIVNTVNLLHVLSFGNDTQHIKPSFDDTIVSEEFRHNIGEKLSAYMSDYICPWKSKPSLYSRRLLTKSTNKAWLNTIMDKAEKVYAFDEKEDGCEKRYKWFHKRRIADKMYEFCSEDDCDNENVENICPPDKKIRIDQIFGDQFSSERERCIRASREDSETDYYDSDSTTDTSGRSNFTLDNKPMCSKLSTCEQSVTKTIFKYMNSGGLDRLFTNNDCDVSSSDNDDNYSEPSCSQNIYVNRQSQDDGVKSCDSAATSPSVPPNTHKTSIINPDLTSILAEWEAESVSSLSPKSDILVNKTRETKNDVIQSFLELIPGITISPRSSRSQRSQEPTVSEKPSVEHSSTRTGSPNSKFASLLVVLRARNCNQEEAQRSNQLDDKVKPPDKEETMTKVKVAKESDLVMRQRIISGCSIKFDRIYIEVDEEIMSNITDIEDDDLETGFHCALPLSVHGSAYAQLQMVSSQKAERMNIHSERVYQASLDIEQFCNKAAQIICKCEGFQFWFCNDYDVEIIDVCSLTGNILGVVCLRMNAEKKSPKTERYSVLNQRFFYEACCIFTWNSATDHCWLEAYSHLVDVTKRPKCGVWMPAIAEAARIRKVLQSSSQFSPDWNSPIRLFVHQLWSGSFIQAPSIKEIKDHKNLIGFMLDPSYV